MLRHFETGEESESEDLIPSNKPEKRE